MMEVTEPWTEVFSGSERTESSGEAETLSGSSLTLTPLISDSPSVRRSQPILIPSNRKVKSLYSPHSIPNPFPELCGSSKSPVHISSLPPESSDKYLVKVYGEESYNRSVWVSRRATAREVCHMLVQTAHCSDQENWALLEHHPTLGLERCLEDHEVVLEVQATWSLKSDTRLVFCKNYAKYEFFRKPVLFFPEAMISDSADVGKGMTPSELIQNLLRSGTCPEIQGFLQVKEPGRKTWKKVYFFLRRSGLYSSTKGSSKEPRHLQCVADLNQLNVYTVVNGRKLYGAPTDFTFCIKLSKNPVRVQDLRILSAEDESTRTCWMSAFRLFKYGKQLQYNYHLSKLSPHSLEGSHLSDGRSKSEDSLVAMDFSGKSGGRVIQNPTEAQSAEREEGRAWRKREALRCNLPNMNSDARPSSVHCGQPWFHGGMCRRKAERLIEKQGLVDGMFLIRDSQNHEQCFVLSLCHQLKVKHYLVIPFEKEGMNYFTIDDGETLFIDLLQLVEFHQVNPGILPVRLKHPCVCIAL
ncbi:growth factor receptor-bound protein 7 [Nothobranchius furzeri]|uniref:Growth factor receptor-bound protein 7 n=2 Tax=Nothobranchius furzeri TaxID=105023 RepID=A0A1A7ZUM8_NOTFU|nr:growth factor receptor-bound protein 7 [Nothobranchius furzeri]XP_054605501.1 growth factor receptor-bound protein 7 [Nothobranchius furzeri]KAF7203745.1 growth factor receptor-bound protein 7-like [Nothobranchius furzeri]